MNTNLHETFLKLVRLGIGHTESTDNTEIKKLSCAEWGQLKALAEEQGLSAIVLDGLNTDGMDLTDTMPLEMKLEWIGEVLQGESVYAHQRAVAVDVANLFYHNAIRTYVLKGNVISECYQKPNHRVSVDIDCFLLPNKGDFDAWSLGNDLIRAKGFIVNTDFYKNSSFDISGVYIENHQYMTPFRGNARLTSFEKLLQNYLRQDKGEDVFEGTHLYRPPVLVTALFLIEHSYSHFLHEGLTWRHVLDWMLFSKKHHDDINWVEFDAFVDEFGFRKFYDVFSRLCQYLIGDVQEFNSLSVQEKRMLDDIWAPLDIHETVRGWKGKLALAGNTWRARWKYSYFTGMSWITALGIQVKGFLFEKNPKLN